MNSQANIIICVHSEDQSVKGKTQIYVNIVDTEEDFVITQILKQIKSVYRHDDYDQTLKMLNRVGLVLIGDRIPKLTKHGVSLFKYVIHQERLQLV